MNKKKVQLVCGAKYKKATIKRMVIVFAVLLGLFLLVEVRKEPGSVVFIEPTEISTGVLVTPTPEPTPTAELVEPVENTFTGDVEEVYTPLQGDTFTSDGKVITRQEIVGTEEFQQSHEGEVATDQSGQEIGWVEDSSLPQQELEEVSIPEVLTPTPQPTTTPIVDETVSSEPAEPTVQEEQQAPEASTPVVEEVQPEPIPENILDAQPETDIVVDTETGEVSGEAEPQGEDLCGPAYGYAEGLFFWDGQGCVFKG